MFEKRSTAFVKFSIVLSASPCSMPSRTQCLMCPLENDLAAAVQRGFGCIDLRKNILARDVLVHHAVDGLHLTDDLFEPTVQIVSVHTLFHRLISIPVGVSALCTLRRDFVNMRCRAGFVRLWRKKWRFAAIFSSATVLQSIKKCDRIY